MTCPYLFDNKHHGFTLTRVGWLVCFLIYFGGVRQACKKTCDLSIGLCEVEKSEVKLP
jgi:hypothetical protein